MSRSVSHIGSKEVAVAIDEALILGLNILRSSEIIQGQNVPEVHDYLTPSTLRLPVACCCSGIWSYPAVVFIQQKG